MPRKKLYKVDENKTQNGDTTNLQLQFKKLDTLRQQARQIILDYDNANKRNTK